MKSNYVVLASALLISIGTFAQKEQIKAAEKALKSGSPSVALTSLKEAEPLITSATPDEKAQYYYVKGNAHLELANKNVESGKNYTDAANAYVTLMDIEKQAGKSKYSKLAEINQLTVLSGLKNAAFDDYKKEKYKEASDLFYSVYTLDKTNTDFLYNASNSAYKAELNDKAVTLLKELIAINYTGERTDYVALDKLTKQKEYFDSEKSRDEGVKSNKYEQPSEEKVISKRGEIYKQLAGILVKQGKMEEAKTAFTEAKAANPNDPYLALSEANLYYQANDMATYQKLITAILEKDPNNKDLIYNLGVVSYNNKDYDNALKFYTRVTEIDQSYSNAFFYLAAINIDKATAILDTMSKLGTSAADNKKYDMLKKQRDDLLVVIKGNLEKVVALDDANIDAKISLASVYNALEMPAEAKAMKEKIKAQEAKQ